MYGYLKDTMIKGNLVSKLRKGFYTGLAAGGLTLSYLSGCKETPIEPEDKAPRITTSYLSPTSGIAPVSVTARLTCSDDNAIKDYTLINGLERVVTKNPVDTTFVLNDTRDITLKCSDSKGQEVVYGPRQIQVTQPPPPPAHA